ncbi:hypothetical protein ARMGADRAFT_1084870 [Armillaria gallica]|uniref:Uncharacterized protein n=1 Tax=Armillaria gallica TaxID=47427 RepID=A0A2H3DLA2_ARMGA|nr:hypothetical protein ARMGADRAFT_1084870 [Armillaria gallica]
MNLNFSGHLSTYLGSSTSARTDFGQYILMKLVSSWPNLRTLAGDTNGSENCSTIPPTTCALDSVTFERCMSNFEKLAPMFAGSTSSLKSFEAYRRSDLSSLLSSLSTLVAAITPRKTSSWVSSRMRLASSSTTLTGELEEAAKKKGVWAELVSRDLEYKVEGAQRRAGFAAMGERGY